MEGGGRRLSWTARNANAGRRGRKGAMPLRANDRGAAALRSDMSNRGRVGRAHFLCPNGWQQWPHRSFGNLPGQCDESAERRRTFRLDGGSGFRSVTCRPCMLLFAKNYPLLARRRGQSQQHRFVPARGKIVSADTGPDKPRCPFQNLRSAYSVLHSIAAD
nr:hypothetical protein K4M20_00204 [Agrobacterium fabrum]